MPGRAQISSNSAIGSVSSLNSTSREPVIDVFSLRTPLRLTEKSPTSAGGATTGDDALAMSLSRILKWDIQWVYLITDFTVLGLSLTYIPLGKLVYSFLTVLLSGQIIGWIQKIPARKAKEAP